MDIEFEAGPYQGYLDDSLFEPQAAYEFEESHEQEMRNMHHNIAALHAFLPVNSNCRAPSARCGDSSSSVYPSGGNGRFPIETEGYSVMAGPSSQSVSNTSNGWNGADASMGSIAELQFAQPWPIDACHQYSQSVPIDEYVSETSGSKPSHSPRSNSSMSKAKSDKSERARHAANQRHARPKKERVDSQQEGADAEHSEGRVGDKREKYREKNRVAAAKCRAKKKENTESLEGQARAFQARNSSLKRTERELRNELVSWQHAVLAHNIGDPECTCDELHDFNQRRARKLATGWDPTMCSPSQDSNSSMIASPQSVDAGMVPFSREVAMAGSQRRGVAPPHVQFNQPSHSGSMRVATDSEVVDGQQFPVYLQMNAGGR